MCIRDSGWPGISICACAAGFSAGASAAASAVRALLVARRFGLASAVSAAVEAAALGAPLPACASLMTSISWLLRIRAVPLIPRPDATCCSSARTMPSRPVPVRRRLGAAPAAGALVSTEVSAAPIRSVVSLTKGPSLERTSACLARRPVVLSDSSPRCGPCRGGGPPVEIRRKKRAWLVPARSPRAESVGMSRRFRSVLVTAGSDQSSRGGSRKKCGPGWGL